MVKKIKVDKNKIVTYVLNAQLNYKIAKFGDDGVIIAENWIKSPVEVLENIGEVAHKQSDNVAESVAKIGIVKNANGDVGLGLIDEVGKINNAGGRLAKAWKSGWSKQKVLDLPKGSRPNPSIHLDQKYIDQHLAKFDDGASRIVLKKDYDKYGIGKPDKGKTEFVSTKSEVDEILKLPIADQSKKLGIPVEQLQGGEVLRIDFKPTNKIEIPTGNEFGANNQWIPGGKLPEGNLEAVIKTEGMVVDSDYIVNIIGSSLVLR